jgi:hypothetical protein
MRCQCCTYVVVHSNNQYCCILQYIVHNSTIHCIVKYIDWNILYYYIVPDRYCNILYCSLKILGCIVLLATHSARYFLLLAIDIATYCIVKSRINNTIITRLSCASLSSLGSATTGIF